METYRDLDERPPVLSGNEESRVPRGTREQKFHITFDEPDPDLRLMKLTAWRVHITQTEIRPGHLIGSSLIEDDPPKEKFQLWDERHPPPTKRSYTLTVRRSD